MYTYIHIHELLPPWHARLVVDVHTEHNGRRQRGTFVRCPVAVACTHAHTVCACLHTLNLNAKPCCSTMLRIPAMSCRGRMHTRRRVLRVGAYIYIHIHTDTCRYMQIHTDTYVHMHMYTNVTLSAVLWCPAAVARTRARMWHIIYCIPYIVYYIPYIQRLYVYRLYV